MDFLTFPWKKKHYLFESDNSSEDYTTEIVLKRDVCKC